MATVCTSELTSICEDRFYQTVSDGLHREGRERAASLAQDERCVARQIDHRAGLGAARTGVDHEVDAALEPRANLIWLGERLLIPGQEQRRRKHRLVELRQQRGRHRMTPHAPADGLAP